MYYYNRFDIHVLQSTVRAPPPTFTLGQQERGGGINGSDRFSTGGVPPPHSK